MRNYSQTLQAELDSQLQFIRFETDDQIKTAELSMKILLSVMHKLKAFTIKYKFCNDAEEIAFFKKIKPQFLSKLIYYNKVLHIETKKPHGGRKVLKKYFCNELIKLKVFFDSNLEFYKYYRTGSTYLDHKYFMRGKPDLKLGIDTYFFESDPRFATTHDYKVAKIIAHDLIEVYLEDELAKLEKENSRESTQDTPKFKMNWTDTKTSLIELIYALHTQGVFNNSQAEIKDIAAYFESVFNIDLGDYYRTYLELRNRKTGSTKFIDTIRENLLRRMDEAEER